MQSNQRVEEQHSRTDPGDGLLQALSVLGVVEVYSGGGDEAQREALERDASGPCDAADPVLDRRGRVLRGVQQDVARVVDGEATETGAAAGHRDRELEGQPGLPRSSRVPGYAA